jgi:hypothetical protein
LARRGQSFSTSIKGVELTEDQVELIDDIERNNYNFTDGCGFISADLAKELAGKFYMRYVSAY